MHKAATPHLSSPRRETSPSAVGSGAQLLFVDKEIDGNAKTLTPGATPIRLDSSCGARPQDVGLEGASCNVNTGTQHAGRASLSSALGGVDIELLERRKNCNIEHPFKLHLSAEIGSFSHSSEAAGAAGTLAGGLGLTLEYEIASVPSQNIPQPSLQCCIPFASSAQVRLRLRRNLAPSGFQHVRPPASAAVKVFSTTTSNS